MINSSAGCSPVVQQHQFARYLKQLRRTRNVDHISHTDFFPAQLLRPQRHLSVRFSSTATTQYRPLLKFYYCNVGQASFRDFVISRQLSWPVRPRYHAADRLRPPIHYGQVEGSRRQTFDSSFIERRRRKRERRHSTPAHNDGSHRLAITDWRVTRAPLLLLTTINLI